MKDKTIVWSFAYLVLGLLAGVVYREYTKLAGFEGSTTLSVLHTHILILGFVFLLLAGLVSYVTGLGTSRRYGAWLGLYQVGLLGTTAALAARGVLQVQGRDFAGLPHISGLFHVILGVALIWFMVMAVRKISAGPVQELQA